MIPGIDMLNHSTRPEDVNTSLQRREETVNRHGDDYEDSVDFTGFFAIEAGAPLTHLNLYVCPLFLTPGRIPHMLMHMSVQRQC